MRVTVLCLENSAFREVLETPAVRFVQDENEFHMDAGGYLLRTTNPFVPQKHEADATALTVTFQTQLQASEFLDWLKSAARDAYDSFTRMLD